MSLYSLLRRPRFFYLFIYKCLERNYNEKIVRRIISTILKFTDWLFLFVFPITMGLRCYFEKNAPQDTFWVSLNQTLVAGMKTSDIVGYTYKMFLIEPYLFTGLSMLCLFSSRYYIKSLRTHENESLVCQKAHFLMHKYRDFMDKMPVNAQLNVDEANYQHAVEKCCSLAKDTMRRIVNDNECYVDIRILSEDDPEHKTMRLTTFYKSPEDVKDPLVLKGSKLFNRYEESPRNIYQYIINKHYSVKESGADLWDLGFLSNDFKGHSCYNKVQLTTDDKKYKSCIILPVTTGSQIKGFLGLYSVKAGRLRTKHRHFISAIADKIANDFRCMPSLKA